MDAEDRVGLVVLPAEEVLQLELIELLFGGVDFGGDPLLGLAEVDEHLRVGDFLVERGERIELAADCGRLVENRPGFGLIGPERRAGHDIF